MGDWDYLDEMPYKKARKTKTPKKANHRHIYRPIVLHAPNVFLWNSRDNSKFCYYLARRCEVCGKVIGTWSSYARESNGLYRRYGFPVRELVNLELTRDVYSTDAIGFDFPEGTEFRLVRRADT